MKPCCLLSSDALQLHHNRKHHCPYFINTFRDEECLIINRSILGRRGRKQSDDTNAATITSRGKDLLPGTNDTYSWIGSKERRLITVIDRLKLS